MKKIYASILMAMLGTTALMAQEEETTFSFVRNGEVIPNGSTVTISECMEIPGVLFSMESEIYIKNNSDDNEKAVVHAVGLENYEEIEVCAGGNCWPWNNGELTSKVFEMAANEQQNAQIHVFSTKGISSFKGSVKVDIYYSLDPDDCASITVVFDTNGSGINEVTGDKKEIEVFNLCGKKIANSTEGLNKGIYIVKQGNTSKKVTIR